jgi:hypothetical protein
MAKQQEAYNARDPSQNHDFLSPSFSQVFKSPKVRTPRRSNPRIANRSIITGMVRQIDSKPVSRSARAYQESVKISSRVVREYEPRDFTSKNTSILNLGARILNIPLQCDLKVDQTFGQVFEWRIEMTQKVSMRISVLSLTTAMAASSFAFVAFDSASNAVYTAGQEYIQVGTPAGNQTAATNGLNGGFGWNAWQRGGYGAAPNNGTTLITSLDASFGMGSQQFGVRSGPNGQNGADARRRLLNPLSVGQGMSWSMMAGGGGAGAQNTTGEFGAEIRSSLLGNPGRDMANIIGETGDFWRVFQGPSGSTGSIRSTLAVTAGKRVDVNLVITSSDTFAITFSEFGGASSTVTGQFLSSGQQVQTVQFYNAGGNGDFYVNNIGAVPEPASMIALGSFVALTIRRRRRSS